MKITHFARFVVCVTVGEHAVKVGDTVLCAAVVLRLKALLYRTHVHRLLYDLVVILHDNISYAI